MGRQQCPKGGERGRTLAIGASSPARKARRLAKLVRIAAWLDGGVVKGEMRKIKPRDFSDALIRQGEKRAANLAYIERPATPFTTPALDAAKAALDGAGIVQSSMLAKHRMAQVTCCNRERYRLFPGVLSCSRFLSDVLGVFVG